MSGLEGLARRESMTLPAARPSWDATFMDVAAAFSRRATCPRLHVGAVLVRDGVVLANGFNGARRGAAHCDAVGCDMQTLNGRESCQRAVHAEANAILNAGRAGHATVGATLYVTASPCLRCVDAIIQAGVVRVVWRDAYGDAGVHALAAAGVMVKQMEARP